MPQQHGCSGAPGPLLQSNLDGLMQGSWQSPLHSCHVQQECQVQQGTGLQLQGLSCTLAALGFVHQKHSAAPDGQL